MKQLLVLVFGLCIGTLAKAQTYEIGLVGGGFNFIGDVGSTTWIAPNKLAGGGIIKWNRSPRHAFRASLLVGYLSGDDSKSDEPRREQRGRSFSTGIVEGSVGLEYNFWEFDLNGFDLPWTPYLHTGLTVLNRPNSVVNNGGIEFPERVFDFAIPMGLGIKKALSRKIIIAAEISARYTFTDNIDTSDVEAVGNEDPAPFKFGNPNTNDWYMFTGISITYTFGRQPCYCGF